MNVSILEYEKKMWQLVEVSREHMPELTKANHEMKQAAYGEGSLDSKTKRLMALAIGVQAGCRDCMLTQAKNALELGATPEEIIETCSVAISMGGTLAWSKTLVVFDYLREKELI